MGPSKNFFPACAWEEVSKKMSLSQLGNASAFQNHAQGMIGEFSTPAGRVAYLMTKARLGPDATDPERRLTRHLVPVREVIPAEELDFNQLLQRDLDDHRVAVSLVPYLINNDWTGPAFFPPIVAVALPFTNQKPSEFPEFIPRQKCTMDCPGVNKTLDSTFVSDVY